MRETKRVKSGRGDDGKGTASMRNSIRRSDTSSPFTPSPLTPTPPSLTLPCPQPLSQHLPTCAYPAEAFFRHLLPWQRPSSWHLIEKSILASVLAFLSERAGAICSQAGVAAGQPVLLPSREGVGSCIQTSTFALWTCTEKWAHSRVRTVWVQNTTPLVNTISKKKKKILKIILYQIEATVLKFILGFVFRSWRFPWDFITVYFSNLLYIINTIEYICHSYQRKRTHKCKHRNKCKDSQIPLYQCIICEIQTTDKL